MSTIALLTDDEIAHLRALADAWYREECTSLATGPDRFTSLDAIRLLDEVKMLRDARIRLDAFDVALAEQVRRLVERDEVAELQDRLPVVIEQNEVRGDAGALHAECERMRPIYEAALDRRRKDLAFDAAHDRGDGLPECVSLCEEWERAEDELDRLTDAALAVQEDRR